MWQLRLVTWMNARFPCNGGHQIHIYAISGAGSANHLSNIPTIDARFKQLARLDMILLELGANDLKVEDAPYTEALVSALVTLRPQVAIMMVTTISPSEHFGGPGSPVSTSYDDLPESKNHWPIARHLTLPLISIMFALFNSPAKSGNLSTNLYTENARNPSSPLFREETSCGNRCVLWPDGLHLSAPGHSLLASTLAMFWLEMIPRVRGASLSRSPLAPIDVVAPERTLFPQTKNLSVIKPQLKAHSFIDPGLPKGFRLPLGWTHVSERGRFGLAAFAVCNENSRRAGGGDNPCSEPLKIEIASKTVVFGFLRSYRDMGMFFLEAPPELMFDFCEFPLQQPNSRCYLDGIFAPDTMVLAVSLPWQVRLHLVPNSQIKAQLAFPLNLTLHVASQALAANLTSTNITFFNEAGQRVYEPPIRGLQKVKVLRWHSLVE